MRARAFRQVDVFTSELFGGNPLAVVLDGTDLSTAQMQAFTDWTNLSEATFILPPTQPGADYLLRIFCPGRELPFAGHPTLGSCHAWLQAGGQPKAIDVVQECGAGLVAIRREGPQLAFAAPPLRRSGPLGEDELALLAHGLGVGREEILHHSWCDNGPGWRAVYLTSAQQVLALRPDASVLGRLDVGVIGPYTRGGPAELEVRAFFPGTSGMTEDPVTGSLNAALAQWLMASGLAPPRYLVSQGTVIGRSGRVHVRRDANGSIWVGGESVTCIEGTALL